MIYIFVLAGILLLIPAMLLVTLFVENILFLDSLIIAAISAAWIRSVTGIHPVYCILLGFGLLAVLMLLYIQRYMFWLFTTLSAFMWSSMTGYLLHDITNDWIWAIFTGGIIFMIVLGLHLYTRTRMCG